MLNNKFKYEIDKIDKNIFNPTNLEIKLDLNHKSKFIEFRLLFQYFIKTF